MKKVYGILVHPDTRCIHYHLSCDIVAIQFKCCKRYYACFLCHLTLERHAVQRWLAQESRSKAILCGKCRAELTIHDYWTCDSRCPHCKALFNPNCRLHWGLYFEKAREGKA